MVSYTTAPGITNEQSCELFALSILHLRIASIETFTIQSKIFFQFFQKAYRI